MTHLETALQNSFEQCCIFQNDIRFLIGGIRRMNNVMDQEERLYCVSLVANFQYAAEEKMNLHITAQIVSTNLLFWAHICRCRNIFGIKMEQLRVHERI